MKEMEKVFIYLRSVIKGKKFVGDKKGFCDIFYFAPSFVFFLEHFKVSQMERVFIF